MRRHGFTLIELLVVIAIISLLVSILLPSLNRAKEVTRRAIALSNTRNIGLAMQLYTEDHEDRYPYCLRGTVGGDGSITNPDGSITRKNIAWYLLPYVSGPELFRDPGDTGDSFIPFYPEYGSSFEYCSWGAGIVYASWRETVVVINMRTSEVVRPSTKATVRNGWAIYEFDYTDVETLYADLHVERADFYDMNDAWWRDCVEE